MMNQDLLDRIDQRLRAKDLTDYRASMLAAGRPEIIRNIRRGLSKNPRRDTLEKLAGVLDCSFEWLATGRGPVEPPADIGVVPGDGPGLPPREQMPSDIPVMGTAAGGLEGAFQMQAGEAIDHVRRPPGVATAVDVYAIYVVGDSMVPRFEEGELIYVSGKRPARPGDYVVVQTSNADGEITAWCKKLVSRDAKKIVLAQFNPEGTFEVPSMSTVAVHRILTLNDLFGV
ncbi:S24 family peptidase [Minwuia sp.]|uniref:S24 family peptidase n=1 Tax=Minwuia sp. TaxID=2493630 RepID=UPI003A94ABF6